jgi:hypothetical protein
MFATVATHAALNSVAALGVEKVGGVSRLAEKHEANNKEMRITGIVCERNISMGYSGYAVALDQVCTYKVTRRNFTGKTNLLRTR